MLRKTLAALVATPAAAAMSVFTAAAATAMGALALDVLKTQRVRRASAGRGGAQPVPPGASAEAARIMATPLCAVEDDPVEQAIDMRTRRESCA